MTRLNSKKMLTVLISVAMIFSALAIISFAAQPAYAASGTFSTTPGVFSAGVPTATLLDGGTFGTGSTIYLYLSSNGVYASTDPQIGTVTIPANTNSFAYTLATITIPSGTPAGSYYILAEDLISGAPSGTFAVTSSTITVTTLTPTISVSPTSQTAGGSVLLSGSGFDPSATISINLYESGAVPIAVTVKNPSSVPLTAVTGSGAIPADEYATVPDNLPMGVYSIVVTETTGTNSGVTADASINIQPAVGVTLTNSYTTPGMLTAISGAAETSFYLSVFGFPAGATIPASTVVANAITVGGVSTTEGGASISSTTGKMSTALSVTLNAAITTVGPQTISVTVSAPSGTYTFTDAIWVSQAGVSPSIMLIDGTTGSATGNVGDTVYLIASGFGASTAITLTFDGQSPALTTVSSVSSLGFLYATFTVPSVQGGTYTVFASDTDGYAAFASFVVTPLITIEDSIGSNLNGEYAHASASSSSTTDSVIVITASGLSPYQQVDVTDQGIATVTTVSSLGMNIYDGYYSVLSGSPYSSTATLVAALEGNTYSVGLVSGTLNSAGDAFLADGSGQFEVGYTLAYTGLSTGTSETVSLVSLPSGTSLATASYYAIGKVTTNVLPSYLLTATATLTFSGLVPYGAVGTPQSTGYLAPFQLQRGIAAITQSSPAGSTFKDTTSGTATVSFVLSANGFTADNVYTLNAVGESGLGSTVYSDPEFIVSTPGTSGSTVYVNPTLSTYIGSSTSPYYFYPDPTSIVGFGLEFDLYNFPANGVVTVTYYTNMGANTATVTTDANGAGTYFFAAPNAVGGTTYLLSFSAKSGTTPITITGTGASITYQLTPAVSFTPTPFSPAGSPATDYKAQFFATANSGSNVTLYMNSLAPDASYNVYLSTSTTLGSNVLTTFQTNVNGNANVTVMIPNDTASGTYYLDVALTSSLATSVTASYYATIEVSNYVAAFPGMIVQFSLPITGTPLPKQPGTGILSGTSYNTYGTVYVNVMFNSTAYVTVPAVYGTVDGTVYLNGSYLAPNAAAGTYFAVTYNWTQSYSSGTFVGGTPASTESFSISGPVAGVSELTIVTGSGALLIAISTQGIATLITNSINSAMKVPLAELDAVITSLNSTSVKITTAFGNMTTTLAAIKANVTSVVSGVAVLSTELGNVQTSLASLNATIVSLNGTTATLSTSLGQVKTTLSGINATVTSVSNGVATVQTSLGTLTGTVTAMNGTVATISTNVGTIQTTLGQVKAYTSGFSTLEIFLIVAIVLILITLVIAFLAVSSSNKVARKIEEQKKQ